MNKQIASLVTFSLLFTVQYNDIHAQAKKDKGKVYEINQGPIGETNISANFISISNNNPTYNAIKNTPGISTKIEGHSVVLSSNFHATVSSDNFFWIKSKKEAAVSVSKGSKAISTLFNVYPNPTTGFFTLELPKKGNYEIRITSMVGSIVHKMDIHDLHKAKVQLDNQLHSGNYLVFIEGEGINQVKKITLIK